MLRAWWGLLGAGAVLAVAVLAAAPVSYAQHVRGPASIDITPDGKYAVIAYRRDQSVSVVDVSKEGPFEVRNVTRDDGIPLCPLKVRCYGDKAVLVADLCEQLTVVDVPSGRVERKVDVPMYCQDVLWDEERARYYVTNRYTDSVLVYDADWKQTGQIPVGRRPAPMTFGPRGRLWVGNRGTWDVSVVDLDHDRELTRVYIGSRPEDLAATGDAVLVTNHGGAELPRVNGVPLVQDDQTDIRNIVTAIDPVTLEREERFEDRGADYAGIDVRAGLIAFTGQGSGTVHVHPEDGASDAVETLDILADPALQGGTGPDGKRFYTHTRDVAVRSRDQLFAVNFLRDSLVELRRSPEGKWGVHSETALNSTGRPVLAYPSPGEPSLRPRQLGQLHLLTISAWEGAQKDFTCFTCHSDWHSDFRLFFDGRPDPFHPEGRPQGPERNPTLRWMSRFAPYGWEGSIEDLTEFNRSTVGIHASLPSGITPSPEIAEQIRLTEEILTPGPNPFFVENERGEALFHGKAGCATCHPAPDYTDRRRHDVGTGRVLDTPSLLGAWDLVRYLHDARAATLLDLLDPAIYEMDAPSHGNLAALSSKEKIDLAEYVRSLGDKRVFRDGAAFAEERNPGPQAGDGYATAQGGSHAGHAPGADEPVCTLASPPLESAPAVPVGLVPRAQLPALVRSLAHEDPAVRLEAARALRRVEREPWDHLQFVGGILTDGEPDLSEAVPPLARCLEDPVADVRAEAAGVLGLFGKSSRPAVPALLRALAGDDERLRVAAAIALGKIGATEAVAPLVSALRDGASSVPMLDAAALAIGRIHDGTEVAVPVLAGLLEDPRAQVRRLAAVALGKIGPASSPAVAALSAALEDPCAGVRDMAALALGRIRDEGGSSVASLVRALDDPAEQVRRRAARSLGFLREESAPAIPALIRMLRGDTGARHEAGWALGRIGERAIPALEELARDARDASVRMAAERALAAASSPYDP